MDEKIPVRQWLNYYHEAQQLKEHFQDSDLFKRELENVDAAAVLCIKRRDQTKDEQWLNQASEFMSMKALAGNMLLKLRLADEKKDWIKGTILEHILDGPEIENETMVQWLIGEPFFEVPDEEMQFQFDEETCERDTNYIVDALKSALNDLTKGSCLATDSLVRKLIDGTVDEAIKSISLGNFFDVLPFLEAEEQIKQLKEKRQQSWAHMPHPCLGPIESTPVVNYDVTPLYKWLEGWRAAKRGSKNDLALLSAGIVWEKLLKGTIIEEVYNELKDSEDQQVFKKLIGEPFYDALPYNEIAQSVKSLVKIRNTVIELFCLKLKVLLCRKFISIPDSCEYSRRIIKLESEFKERACLNIDVLPILKLYDEIDHYEIDRSKTPWWRSNPRINQKIAEQIEAVMTEGAKLLAEYLKKVKEEPQMNMEQAFSAFVEKYPEYNNETAKEFFETLWYFAPYVARNPILARSFFKETHDINEDQIALSGTLIKWAQVEEHLRRDERG